MKVSNADPVASSGPPGLVIFDCDGVIVDSERLIVQVESELISAEGWQLSPAEVARLFLGTSDDYMYREIERTIGRPLGEKWKRNLHESYARRFAESLQAVPGVTALLDWLDMRNIQTCVATNGTLQKMSKALAATGLMGRFEGRCFSAELVEQGKPAPDLFLYVALVMGMPQGRCVVVEDSPSGLAAAGAAGMTVLAYANEFVSDDTLPFDVPVVRSMEELLSLFRDPFTGDMPQCDCDGANKLAWLHCRLLRPKLGVVRDP